MAKLVWIEKTGSDDARISQSKREYTDYYRGQVQGDRGIFKAILLGYPQIAPFQPYPDDPAALVQDMQPKRIEDSDGYYDIQVNYSTDVAEEESDNPLARAPKITGGSSERTRIRLVDEDGKPCLNTAGELMDDPPPEVEQSDLVFTVAKNLPVRLPFWLITYRNAVNSDTVRIKGLLCEPGTLKFKNSTWDDDDTTGKIPFVPAKFELHFREEGWSQIVPNRGWNQRVPITRKSSLGDTVDVLDKKGKQTFELKPILVRGERPSEPPFLDKDGKHIEAPTEKNIVLLEFNFSKRLPFNGVLPLK